MRHPCNLCSLQFATEKILEKHVASFHINPDASRVQPILPVVLEKIKIEPELITLDEEEDDDDQSTSTVQKQPPKAIFKKTAITQIVKRLKPKDCYQCEVCLETFSLLRYFRKHLATAEEQGVFKCQEHYKANITNGYVAVYNKSCVEGIANAENGLTTEKEHSQSRQRTTAVRVQTGENSKDVVHVMTKSSQPKSSTENAEVQMAVPNTTETFPIPQDASCKECHLTCPSYEQLCVHYSKHHNLPVVVLKHVDKNEVNNKYKRHLESGSKNNGFKCDTCTRTFSSRYYLIKHTASGPCANCQFSDNYLKTVETDISSSKINTPKARIDLCKKIILKYPKKPHELRKNKIKLSLLGKHNFSAKRQHCHKCNICKRQFSSPVMLRKHQLAVHNNQKGSLNNIQHRMGELLSTRKEFHKLSAHDRFRFKCDLCQRDFSTNKYLKLHKRGAHDGFRHKCELCPKDFLQLVSLKMHKRTVHNGVRHRCELCPKTFSQKGHLSTHKRTVHDGVRYKCQLCQKTFAYLRSLNLHKQSVHDGIRHRCKSCPKEFTMLSHLKQHKLIAHDNVRQKCEICLKEFTHMHHLKQHILSVHDGVRHNCELCPKTFAQLGYLNTHKRTVHDGCRHKCKSCPKTFPYMQHLKRHTISVHEGVRYNCEFCPKPFTLLGNLNQHKQTSHDGTRHNCDLCPETFAQLDYLNRHKRTVHDGVGLKCELCPKTFLQLRTLNQHKQTVHDRVRHKCELCPKTFSQLGYLNQHKRAVHAGVRNTCDVCQKNFCSSRYLKQHKITVHHV